MKSGFAKMALASLAFFALSSCQKVMRLELSTLMAEQSERCPMPAGQGMMQTMAELNDTCCLFVIEYDGGMYPTQFESYAKQIKGQLLSNINITDPGMRTPLNELADAAKFCNLPLVYIYKNNKTGAETVVKVQPSEIAE